MTAKRLTIVRVFSYIEAMTSPAIYSTYINVGTVRVSLFAPVEGACRTRAGDRQKRHISGNETASHRSKKGQEITIVSVRVVCAFYRNTT